MKLFIDTGLTLSNLDLMMRWKISYCLLRAKSKGGEAAAAKEEEPTGKHLETMLHNEHNRLSPVQIFFPNLGLP